MVFPVQSPQPSLVAPGYCDITADRRSGLVPGKVKELLPKLRVRDTGAISSLLAPTPSHPFISTVVFSNNIIYGVAQML